jgi:putative holliday junction resolvase
MRTIGIDYGDKRIGIAISDPLGLTAQGVAVIGKGKTYEEDIKELKKIIKKYEGVDEIVIGLPIKMNGEMGIQVEKVLKFQEALKGAFKIPINTWDERLTTVQADRMLMEAGLSGKKRRKVVDQSAAGFILQNYMDSKKR